MSDQAAVLADILGSVEATKARGETPVLVMDLDHTLFDNGARTVEILKSFAHQTDRPALLDRLGALPPGAQPYLMKDTLANAGETDPAVVGEAFGYWRDRFFFDEWIAHDVAIEGAAQFCRDAFAGGATLVYLTGRDALNMLMGTTASLQQHGFPVGLAHTVMVLKPDFDISDIDFKTEAVSFIATLGTVVAAFDNEPGNCNLFAERFETCHSVLLDTAMAPGAPPLDPSVSVIHSFAR